MPELVLLNAIMVCRDNLKHFFAKTNPQMGNACLIKYPLTVLQSMTNTMHSQIQLNDTYDRPRLRLQNR